MFKTFKGLTNSIWSTEGLRAAETIEGEERRVRISTDFTDVKSISFVTLRLFFSHQTEMVSYTECIWSRRLDLSGHLDKDTEIARAPRERWRAAVLHLLTSSSRVVTLLHKK